MKHLIITFILAMIVAMSVKAEIETINVDVEEAAITDSKLVEFLSGRIVPFLKANDIHPICDEVRVSKSDDSVFTITAINGTTGLPSILACVRNNKCYMTCIDGVRFFILSREESPTWFKPTHTKVHLGQFQQEKGDLLRIVPNDDECNWTVERDGENGYHITNFVGEWSSWFKNEKAKALLPK